MRNLLIALMLAGCPKPHAPEVVTAPTWTLSSGAVGPIVLGDTLPALLPDDAADRYVARFVADGQAYEGFHLDEPAVDIGLAEGPFHDHVARHGFAEPPLSKLAGRAVKTATRQRVASVHIHDPALRTAEGTGVGSTLVALREAHGEAKTHPVPPTFGDDRCMVSVPELPEVWFVFSSCQAAESGDTVSRVDVRSE